MTQRQKVGLIKYAEFSHTSKRVFDRLMEGFPEFNFEIIDFKRDSRSFFMVTHCLKEWGRDILSGNKTISDALLRTAYASNKIKHAISQKVSHRDYAFTFQTQSLFDASVPGVPHFVYTDHTHLANLQYPGFDRNRLFSSWIDREKSIYHNASMNFTMSSNISKSIIKDYGCPADKVECVYCGSNIEVAEHERFDRGRYAKKNILFLGLEWQRKGGPTLIEAFRSVLERHPDATLTIVGCTPKIELQNCRVIGRVPLSSAKNYLQQASIFCLPTTLEPFGIVFLEAMAHRVPIIGTRIGAIPEFIHENKNGFTVEPGNAHQLADRILELIDSPEKCEAFGDYGHALFWKQYTWAKTGQRINETIRRYLA